MPTAVAVLSVDTKGRTTLPEEIRGSLGLRPGDFLLLELTDRGTYELVPASLVPRDQLWFHHPDMQKRIRKAEVEMASARATRTRSIKQARAFLDSLKRTARKPR